MWLTIRPVTGCCQHGDVESGTIKCGEFPEHLIVYQAIWKDFSPCYVLVSWQLYVVSVRFFVMRRAELFEATRAILVDKIFPGVHGTRKLITVFISDRYCFVSRAVNSFRFLSVICSVMSSPDLLLGVLTFWRLTTTIVVVPHRWPLNVAFYIFIQHI